MGKKRIDPPYSLLKKLIINLLKEKYKPVSFNFLYFGLIKLIHKEDYFLSQEYFNIFVTDMIKECFLIHLSYTNSYLLNLAYREPDKSRELKGIFKGNSKGFGFVIPIDNKDGNWKYFVETFNTKDAINNDIVSFYIIDSKSEKHPSQAVIHKILERKKDFYVCLFNVTDNGYNLTFEDDKITKPVELDDTTGLVDGQKILIKIKQITNDKIYAALSRIIGHKSDPGIDILSIVLDKGIKSDFSNEVLEYSKRLRVEFDSKQKKLRKDLRQKQIVTIDPKTSKDFDDAICVEKEKDQYRLYVSIADVAHYVQFNSLLDQTAFERGCSVYLVDRVIPMLPHILSDDICSLNYNVDRFTLTSEILFNKKGEIISYDVYPSIIKSKQRFSYDEVNEYFKGTNELINDTKAVREMLDNARELHEILNKEKAKRGYITFNVPEPLIILDENNFPIDVVKRESGEAQEMIENFMVKANETVTLFAAKNKLPFIYRVHDKPDKERIEQFALESKRLGFKISTKLDSIKSLDIVKWINDNIDNPNMDLIYLMLLRSMAKAEYAVKNRGHFGLALENYTHFTSPIRRYPDLIVGQILWMYIFDKNNYSDVQRNRLLISLKEKANQSSLNEVVATECEREVNSMKFAEYMTRHIGDEYIGTVVSVRSFGIFVELDNTIDGLIRLPNFYENDHITYYEERNLLISDKTKKEFRLGTKVKIRVIGASKELKQIDFALIEHLGNR